MRVLYVYNNSYESLGVSKKISAQRDFLSEAHEVILLNLRTVNIFKAVSQVLYADRIYCRDGMAVALFIIFFGSLFKKKIALEVNNGKGSLSGRRGVLTLRIRQLLQEIALMRVDVIVGVTPEIISTYESVSAKLIVIPNIWGWNDVSLREVEKSHNQDRDFTFVFLGDLAQLWQGKQRIIRLLELDESRSLLVVGRVTSWPSSVSSRVTQVGVVTCAQQQEIFCRQAEIGVSALAFQEVRSLKQASPLKHLVYCDAGIPILTGCIDNTLVSSGYPHVTWGEHETVEQINSAVDGLAGRSSSCVVARVQIQRVVNAARNNFLEIFN